MPEVKPEIETIAKIKVVGVGGSGGSAVNQMIAAKIRGVDFIAINTDVQALHNNAAKTKFHIGQKLTRGLGAGMNPAVGLAAAQENASEIRDLLKDANMVFITCGLGGGTGTGASPVVAQIAKEMGALVVAVVTKPFTFEGRPRAVIAEEGLDILKANVDAIITIPNEKIWQLIDQKTSFTDAFKEVDDILRQGIQGISEIITVPARINVDFADIKAIMKDAGSALMAIGEASGDNRAVRAAQAAVSSPLLDLSIDGAKGVLFVISGSSDLTAAEVSEIANIITTGADENAKIIFGVNIDESNKDKIKVTLVATGFGNETPKKNIRNAESWTSKINNAIFLETPKKEKEEGSARAAFKSLSRLAPAASAVSQRMDDDLPAAEPVVKRIIRDDNDLDNEDNLDVPPIIRRGGSFRPMETVTRDEEEDDEPSFAKDIMAGGDFDEENEEEENDEDLELPSFIRKKMK